MKTALRLLKSVKLKDSIDCIATNGATALVCSKRTVLELSIDSCTSIELPALINAVCMTRLLWVFALENNDVLLYENSCFLSKIKSEFPVKHVCAERIGKTDWIWLIGTSRISLYSLPNLKLRFSTTFNSSIKQAQSSLGVLYVNDGSTVKMFLTKTAEFLDEISLNATFIQVVGNNLYFIDLQGNLCKFDFGEETMHSFASHVTSFLVSECVFGISDRKLMVLDENVALDLGISNVEMISMINEHLIVVTRDKRLEIHSILKLNSPKKASSSKITTSSENSQQATDIRLVRELEKTRKLNSLLLSNFVLHCETEMMKIQSDLLNFEQEESVTRCNLVDFLPEPRKRWLFDPEFDSDSELPSNLQWFKNKHAHSHIFKRKSSLKFSSTSPINHHPLSNTTDSAYSSTSALYEDWGYAPLWMRRNK